MRENGEDEIAAARRLVNERERQALDEAETMRKEAAALLRRASAAPAPPPPSSGIDTADLVARVRERWWLAAAGLVMGVLAALALTASQTELYRSEVQLFVSTAASDVADLHQGGLFAQQRVKSYAELAHSPAVTSEAIEDLGLEMSPDELAGQIHTRTPLDTVVFAVGVSDPRPSRARDLADAVARSLQELVPELERPDSDGDPPVVLTVVEPAGLPTEPFRPRPLLNVGLGSLAGLTIGLTAAVALRRRDRWTSG